MNREDFNRQKTENTRRRVGRATIQEKSESTGLPPRSEIHQQRREKEKEKKNKKQSFPLIRLQAMFFILLPVIIFIVYTNRDHIFPSSSRTGSEEKSGYETISIDNTDNTDSADSGKKSDTKEAIAEAKEISTNNDENIAGKNNNESSVPQETVSNETNPSTTPELNNPTAGIAAQEPATSDTGSEPVTNAEIKTHTVKAGETLYRIAMTYYGSKSGIDIIKKANNLKSENISVGQVLKIPMN